jgi:hypothetical protein
VAGALGAAGRRHVEDHFGWERIGRKFVDLVDELLGETTRPLTSAGTSR